MKKLFTLFILIAICNFSNGQSNYFPLEKGATYTYAYGSELYNGAYSKMRTKVNILNTTKTINEKEYFVFETFSGSDTSFNLIATSYVRVGTDGSIFSLQDGDEKEHMTVQASPKVGNTWKSKSGTLTSTIRVTLLDGTIQTDDKTYTNCLVLEQKTEDGMIMQSYFKEDVGMVATTIFIDGSEKLFNYLAN